MAWRVALITWCWLLLYVDGDPETLVLDPSMDRRLCEGDSLLLNWTYTPASLTVPIIFWYHQHHTIMSQTSDGAIKLYEDFQGRTSKIRNSNAGIKIDGLKQTDSGFYEVLLTNVDIRSGINVHVQNVENLTPVLTVDNKPQPFNTDIEMVPDEPIIVSIAAPQRAKTILIRVDEEDDTVSCRNSTVCSHTTSLNPSCTEDGTQHSNITFRVEYDVCRPQFYYLILTVPCVVSETSSRTALIVCLVLLFILLAALGIVVGYWVYLRKRQQSPKVDEITKREAKFVNWKYLNVPLTRMTGLKKQDDKDTFGPLHDKTENPYDVVDDADVKDEQPQESIVETQPIDTAEEVHEDAGKKKKKRSIGVWLREKHRQFREWLDSSKSAPSNVDEPETTNLMLADGRSQQPAPADQPATSTVIQVHNQPSLKEPLKVTMRQQEHQPASGGNRQPQPMTQTPRVSLQASNNPPELPPMRVNHHKTAGNRQSQSGAGDARNSQLGITKPQTTTSTSSNPDSQLHTDFGRTGAGREVNPAPTGREVNPASTGREVNPASSITDGVVEEGSHGIPRASSAVSEDQTGKLKKKKVPTATLR